MHYAREIKPGRMKPQAPPDLNAVPAQGSYRSSIALNATLIEAFVAEYLAPKYDYPGGKPIPTPDFHREIWEACADVSKTHVLILAPRGHAKSTSVTEAFGTAALLFRIRDFAVIISNTVGQSIEFLDDFKAELKFNDELRREFGIKELIRDREDDIIVLFTDGHKFRVRAAGSGQEIRGMKWNKRRPNLILCDDLEGKEQLGTSELRKKFSDWFMRDVLPFGADDCLFRYCATIRHYSSLASNLAKNPEWFTLRYKAHKSFDDFSELLWPEKFTEARLRSIRANYIAEGDRDGYSQEYHNVPIAEGGHYFRPEDLISMVPEDHNIPKRYYAAWDFAISKKQEADYTVCAVVGVDARSRFYLVDIRRGRWDSKEIIDEMFAVQKAWNCEVHWAEAGQIEKTIAPFLYDEMQRRSGIPEWAQHAYFTVEPVIPTVDKVSRARGWQAKTRAKAIKFADTTPKGEASSWWEAFLEEMKQFPKGAHDDQVDAQSLFSLSFHSDLLPAPTEQEIAEEEYFENASFFNYGRSAVTGY